MRATLKIASEQTLIDEPLLIQLQLIADQIDVRLHKYQSRLNVLSSITGWTGTELRFNVVS
jgi:hypothetical protein